MSDADPFRQLIARVKAGDADAAQSVWNLYHPAVVRLLRTRLPGRRKRVFDEEDVAASAFLSFFDGIAADRFPDLQEPDNLWSLLAVIAGRKAQAYVRFHERQKRGGAHLRGESVFAAGDDGAAGGIGQVSDSQDSQESVVEFLDELEALLRSLEGDELQAIALMKLDGHSIDEIATEVGISKRAVQRRLTLIRRTWQDAAQAS